MKTPTYITIVKEDSIVLKGLTNEIKEKLKESNLIVSTNLLLEKVISFKNKDEKNSILLKLNDLGVLFGEDYKQGWSPAEIMRDLQDKSLLKKSFKSIYWTGVNQWKTKEN